MYCRGCGEKMRDSDTVCIKCGVKKNEGTSYCQSCGYFTTIKTEFCSHCGAKQRTIITQQMKNAQIAELQRQAKTEKRFMKIAKIFAILGVVLVTIFLVIFLVRPQPEFNGYVAQPWLSNKEVYGYEVQSYWRQSRELLLYMFMSLLMSVGSLISYFMQKSKYKKIIKAIKEAKEKNVL